MCWLMRKAIICARKTTGESRGKIGKLGYFKVEKVKGNFIMDESPRSLGINEKLTSRFNNHNGSAGTWAQWRIEKFFFDPLTIFNQLFFTT